MVPPSPKHPSTNTHKNSEPQKAAVEQKPAEPPKADAPAPEAAVRAGKAETTIVSITVNERLARQARLLAKIRGVTISSLFVEAAAHTIPSELKLALASIKDEVE